MIAIEHVVVLGPAIVSIVVMLVVEDEARGFLSTLWVNVKADVDLLDVLKDLAIGVAPLGAAFLIWISNGDLKDRDPSVLAGAATWALLWTGVAHRLRRRVRILESQAGAVSPAQPH